MTFAKDTFGTLDWLIGVNSDNKLDRWIMNKYLEFAKKIYYHMEKLELTQVPNIIYKFVDDLCNLYIKLSRERMKGLHGEQDCQNSLGTLYYIMYQFNLLLTPFLPHLSEKLSMLLHNIFSIDKTYTSVHMKIIDIEKINSQSLDINLLRGFYSVNELLENIRNLRQQINKPIFYPLQKMILYTDSENIVEFSDIICRELNIKELEIKDTQQIPRTYRANKGIIGKTFKKDLLKISQMIEQGNISWEGCLPSFYTEEFDLTNFSTQHNNYVSSKFNYINYDGLIKQSIVFISTETNHFIEMEAEINNIRRQVNAIRKEMGLKLFNKVKVVFEKCDYWNQLTEETLNILTSRLIADIQFSDQLKFSKSIQTFNGREIRVNIELV
jgi:isoleucyl-tRNA synthetase